MNVSYPQLISARLKHKVDKYERYVSIFKMCYLRKRWLGPTGCMRCHYYRPQTKFAKVMFLQVSVCPWEVCMAGDVRARGHTWLGGMHGRGVWQGACVVGGVCGGGGMHGGGMHGRGYTWGGHVWQGGLCTLGLNPYLLSSSCCFGFNGENRNKM